MLTPVKNSCFHEFLMNIVFSFIYFEIKVMAPIISDNFLSGGRYTIFVDWPIFSIFHNNAKNNGLFGQF